MNGSDSGGREFNVIFLTSRFFFNFSDELRVITTHSRNYFLWMSSLVHELQSVTSQCQLSLSFHQQAATESLTQQPSELRRRKWLVQSSQEQLFLFFFSRLLFCDEEWDVFAFHKYSCCLLAFGGMQEGESVKFCFNDKNFNWNYNLW